MTQPTSQESTLTMFELLKPSVGEAGVARLGRLAFAGGRRTMQTPNYLAVASRGVVPHLTPDNVTKHTTFDASYLAIEDCMGHKY
jgi:queuine tRNA-ribosyltransferase